MIEEALAWFRLGCDAAPRRLGYRHEAAALRVRHRRCAQAWRGHIENTRAALLDAARSLSGRGGTAVLLGSGPLRDVPAAELLQWFDQLRLVDPVVHPEARALARRHPGRVALIRADVTGCIAPLARDPRVIPVPKIPGCIIEGARWIASVNLWSQLPLLPCAWLARHGVGDDRIEQFGQDVLRAHLRDLLAASLPLCVISEVVDRRFDGAGREVDRTDRSGLLRAALAGAVTQRWEWDVNPAGELAGGNSEVREVWVVQAMPAG